ncbi:hypothetical protein H7992_09285 [Sporosarcina sp. resist]|uniref:Cthe_2314 family HEPN domain-containing protein n=1 Tax=Sporosarcina sp. resist TaxID=2762563 RepID=UPI00164E27D3|nr:Cthe_2314 family HEPN domain-containing protein [Sporosarcina sp. resist]QNK89819.1 hypothetical protein H7992_09285 [Sporosarcina sp. resist]
MKYPDKLSSLDKQRLYDKQTEYDYRRILNSLRDNSETVKIIGTSLNNAIIDMENESIKYLLEDIMHLLQTLDYLFDSCSSIEGSNVKFLPHTAFFREYVTTLKVVDGKIYDIFNERKLKDSELFKEFCNISELILKEKNWRNQIEHNIDPFYDGDYFEIINEVNVEKMVLYIGGIFDLSMKLIDANYLKGKVENIKVTYKIVPLSERIQTMSRANKLQIGINEMLCEISHRVMENNKLDDEGKNIIDLGFKYLELNKSLLIVYKDEESEYVNQSYSGLKREHYQYFVRMSISIIYRIFDKLGLYLYKKMDLRIKKSYFKAVIDSIDKKNNNNSSLLIKDLSDLRGSTEYIEMSRIRQNIAHKKLSLDFNRSSEEMRSLITNMFDIVGSIIYSLSEEYFENNSLSVSNRSKSEVAQNSIGKKL